VDQHRPADLEGRLRFCKRGEYSPTFWEQLGKIEIVMFDSDGKPSSAGDLH